MKKYLVPLLCFGAFVLAGCEKEKVSSDIIPPYNYVMCDLEDEESFDRVHYHTSYVGRDGGESVLTVVDRIDGCTSYFNGYSVVVGEPEDMYEPNYKYTESFFCGNDQKGLDNYSCRWFGISRISNHKFKVKFNPISDEYEDKIRITISFCSDFRFVGHDEVYYHDVGAHVFEIY